MAKLIPDTIIDAQLALTEGDVINVCAGQPTTYTEAITTFNLASQAIVGGDFTYANGDASGRKWTLTPPTGTSVTTSGTADHVAITNLGDTSLRLVTTITTPTAITSGNTVDINAFDNEIADPV
jgi:hypothetical protein